MKKVLKKFLVVSAIAAGLFSGTAFAELKIAKVEVLDVNEVAITDGDAYEITSQYTPLSFRVTLISDVRGSRNITGDITVTGNPTLQFRMKDIINGSLKNLTATWNGVLDINEDGDLVMYFDYIPALNATQYPQDYHISPALVGGSMPVIKLVGASIVSSDPAEGSLSAVSARQLNTVDVITDFNTSAQNVSINLFKIRSDFEAPSEVIVSAGSSTIFTVSRYDNDNTLPMTIQATSADRSICDIAVKTGAFPQNSSAPVQFTVNGYKAGTTTISVVVTGHTAEMITIPVTVDLSGDAGQLFFEPPVKEMGEGDTALVRVRLGSAAVNDTTFTISGADPRFLEVPTAVPVRAGQSDFYISLQAINGGFNPSTFTLQIADNDNFYVPATYTATVTNCVPVMTIPTEDGSAIRTGVVDEPVSFVASARDPGKNDNITYRWSFPNGTTKTGAIVDFTFSQAGDYQVFVEANDGDGGVAMGMYTVTIEESVTIVLTSDSHLGYLSPRHNYMGYDGDKQPGKLVYGSHTGVAGADFTIVNPAKAWVPEGNQFRPRSSAVFRATPEADAYPFGWFRASPDYEGIGVRMLSIPNFTVPSVISVTTPEEGSQTLIYLASWPYFEGVDTFGDLDLDGLSDAWEAHYYMGDPDVAYSSDEIRSYAVAIPTGDYGASGNADEDYLPTAAKEVINNVVDGGQVQVFKYPLPSYLVSGASTDTNSAAGSRVAFDNFTEYRGLLEKREGSDYWIAYAPALPLAGTADRGNSPATDPTKADTDGDGLTDGWEYYFWSTIMYEVKSANWRAYDPTWTWSGGIPLLRTQDDPEHVVANVAPVNVLSHVYWAAEVGGLIIPKSLNIYISDPNTGNEYQLFTADTANVGLMQCYLSLDDAERGADSWIMPDAFVPNAASGYPIAIWAVHPNVQFPILVGSINPDDGNVMISADSANSLFAQVMGTPDSVLVVEYDKMNGIFSKDDIMAIFDPAVLSHPVPDTGYAESLGYRFGDKKWNVALDLDNDGLTLEEEYFLGTDPLCWDTDGDGMADGWEILMGLNPLKKDSNANPDQDYMGWDASGNYEHGWAYLFDYINHSGWNGQQDLPFVPGMAACPAAIGLNPTAYNFTNLDEFRTSRYLYKSGWWTVPFGDDVTDYVGGIYPIDWDGATSNPLDNDTDTDGMPDGWELYVGFHPSRGIHMYMDLFFYRNDILVKMLPDYAADPEYYILGAEDPYSIVAEFANTTMMTPEGAEAVTNPNGNTNVTIRTFASPGNWTRKRLPTDPISYDTDGDGVFDTMERAINGIFINYDPCSVDTDCDRLPDSWEVAMQTCGNPNNYENGMLPKGTAPTDDDQFAFGPYGDPDGDGLSNYQEYMTQFVYGWRPDAWYNPENEKFWMPMMGHKDYPYGESVRFRPYQLGDFLIGNSCEDNLRAAINLMNQLERRWAAMAPNGPGESGGWDVTDSRSLGRNGLVACIQRAWEICANPKNQHIWSDLSFTEMDDVLGSYNAYLTKDERDVITWLYNALPSNPFSYGQYSLYWDPIVTRLWNSGNAYAPSGADAAIYSAPAVPLYYAVTAYSTNPRNIDSDDDGMPDYWEVYHGINPLYGGSWITEAGDDIEAYSAVNHPLGDGVTPNSYIAIDESKALAGVVSREETPFYDPMRGHIIEGAPYDLQKRPWLSGDPNADCDKDGLTNFEECYNYMAPDTLSNTDPSPYWLTDPWDSNSHVSRYFNVAPGWLFGPPPLMMGQWYYSFDVPEPGKGAPGDYPQFIWDFEINEGYDTDNDGISDREEMQSTPTYGVSDPQNFDSPITRKAAYFDGNAAMRTRVPFYHDMWTFASFTVEFWFRSDEAPGRAQTLIDRPVFMPMDDLAQADGSNIRHTFLVELNSSGNVVARVDSDGRETTTTAQLVSAGRIVPGSWNHVAVVYNAARNLFSLYINGETAAEMITALKPCNGTLLGQQIYERVDDSASDGEEVRYISYNFSPAPIVLGACDENPIGLINSMPMGTAPKFNTSKFFKGWIDEVRIWDGARSDSDIINDMVKRYTKDDILPINQARRVWDILNRSTMTSQSQFPVKLLYHYSFDTLPDVIPAANRDEENLFAFETSKTPMGWNEISSIRPTPYIPWWFASPLRSTVYNDYSYIPWAENTVAHLPQDVPLGLGELKANYNTTTYAVISYMYNARNPYNWYIQGTEVPVIDRNAYSNGVADVTLPQVLNRMNPYGCGYYTGISAGLAKTPLNFSGELDPLGLYSGTPQNSDLLPLLDAVGDMDVEMWDGNGTGSNVEAIDSDGDGLPDWWELANGFDPYDATGANGAYGDPDGDGLDNFGEYMAGTSPWKADTNGDGYSDYFSRADGSSLTYGELYDDGDSIDNAWEIAMGLDPDSYDSDQDYDEDGWTNYEEYMANTAFNNSSIYPEPEVVATFRYSGLNSHGQNLSILSYAEKTAGAKMGGLYDSRYYTLSSAGQYWEGVLGENGTRTFSIGEYDYEFSISATPNAGLVGAELTTIDLFGVENHYSLTPIDEEFGSFTLPGLSGGIFVHYDTGLILSTSGYNGLKYRLSNVTVNKFTFPYTTENLRRSGEGSRGHLVSGINTFFGFLDVNGNGLYDIDEPAGLSYPRRQLVSWDSLKLNIALTDELFGFPRISWPASPNSACKTYKVVFSGLNINEASIEIDAPRTFLHEGDFLRTIGSGLKLFSTNALVSWAAYASDGYTTEMLTNDSFRVISGPSTSRMPMKAIYPIQKQIVYGSTVEFKWQMDWRNEGAIFTVKNTDTGVVYINKQYIPLPVRHGLVTDSTYYYTATPQQPDASIFTSLPPGNYSYTITEFSNNNKISNKSITGAFQLVDSDESRTLYSITGTLKYFGKLQTITKIASNIAKGDGAKKVLTGKVSTAKFAPGAMSIQVKRNGSVIETISDIECDGDLRPESASNSYSGWLDYQTGEFSVVFTEAPATDITLDLVVKKFPTKVQIAAYKLADNATSGTSISGWPETAIYVDTKGKFKITGLKAGKYAIRAYIDSNGNNDCDDWETQGVAILYGTSAPVLSGNLAALDLTSGNIASCQLVLHDRDTDNDLLPDAWEYKMYGSLTSKSGYDQVSAGLYIWQEYADGALDSDPRTPDTDLDGLTDAMEILVTGTNTHEVDTDGDTVSDLEEFLSGSNPCDVADAKRYSMPELKFDEAGVPYVDCAYPQLMPGVVLTYELLRKPNLGDEAWESVCEVNVAATSAEVTYADGITSTILPAGVLRMQPADLAEADVDFTSGFYRVRITADYGKVVENNDGTQTYWTWVNSGNNTWTYTAAATGKGVLTRDANGKWAYVDDATEASSGTLVRQEDGTWKFID